MEKFTHLKNKTSRTQQYYIANVKVCRFDNQGNPIQEYYAIDVKSTVFENARPDINKALKLNGIDYKQCAIFNMGIQTLTVEYEPYVLTKTLLKPQTDTDTDTVTE